jgi:hypothetical protein
MTQSEINTLSGRELEAAIINGNKLIATFMGWDEENDQYPSNIPDEIWGNFFDNEIKYLTSWDWLMPVVEKISRIEYERGEQNNGFETVLVVDTAYPRTFGMINSQTGNPMVRINRNPVYEAPTLIEATWLAVVNFIAHFSEKETQP